MYRGKMENARERERNSDDRSTIKLQHSSIFMIQYEFGMKQNGEAYSIIIHVHYAMHSSQVAIHTEKKDRVNFCMHHCQNQNSSKTKAV